MKISEVNQQAETMQYVDSAQKPKPPERGPVSQPAKDKGREGDRVDLSPQSKEMQKIYNVLQATPDVRTERVAEVKKLIEEERYQVESKVVAEKMIKESILELNK